MTFATMTFATMTFASPTIGTAGPGPDHAPALIRDAAPS